MDNDSNNTPQPFTPREPQSQPDTLGQSQAQPGYPGQQAPQGFGPQQFNPASSSMPTSPSSKPNNNKALTIVLVAILAVAAIACCAAFIIPNIISSNKNQGGSSANVPNSDSDVPSDQDVKPVGATVTDGEWEVTFPGYTSGSLTVSNETYGFSLPAGVTDVASTAVDKTDSDNIFEYKINGLSTDSGNYDAQTICGYTDSADTIVIAGLIRQPVAAAEPVANGTTIQDVSMISADDYYSVYLWRGLEDASGKCNLDSTKYEEANKLINELLGLSFAE